MMKVFVALGTQKFQFNRILILMEELARQSEYEVFAQRGYSDYSPKNYDSVDFLSKLEFELLFHALKFLIIFHYVVKIWKQLK